MRTVIRTDDAPRAIGPYSQAVRAGGLLFVSGQIAIDPATNEMVPGDVGVQTRRVMENLKAILAAGGSGLDRVVRTTIYLRDLGDFARVNEVYASYFPQDPPARATIQAAALPRGAAVEIDGVALA